MERFRLYLIGAVMFCTCGGAFAQSQNLRERVDDQLQQLQRDARLMPNPDVPPGVRASFDYGLYLTSSFLQIDDAQIRRRRLVEDDITAYARANLDNVHDFLFRGVYSYRDEKPFGNVEEEGWDSRIDRLYYRFDLAQAIAGQRGQAPDSDLAVQVGRDLQYWGTGLVLSRELDSATVDFTLEKKFGVRLLAGVTPKDSIDIDTSRPGYFDNTRRAFYGLLASARLGNHRPFAYLLVQRDHNHHKIEIQSTLGPTSDVAFDYNSIYWGVGSTGALTDRLAYGAELTLETGRSISRNRFANAESNVDADNRQSRDDIHAFASNVQLDYLVGDIRNTRLSASAIYASGDGDRLHTTNTVTGNFPETTDNAFNGFGLLNTGLTYNPDLSNLICLRAGASTFPFTGPDLLSKMQVGVDLFTYFKANASGGMQEASTHSRYLGFESDLFMNWQITSDLTVAVRYGVLFPGSGLQSDDDERHGFFVSATFNL